MEFFDLNTEEVSAWIGQFDAKDRKVARSLLERVKFINETTLRQGLLAQISSLKANEVEPMGLYAERPVKRWKGRPNRLFKETKSGVKRAHGCGPNPVEPTHSGRPETGSEGIVANIITEAARIEPETFFDHPGPDAIRRHKIRRFVLVTDFIGTGTQASRYLDAAWRIASVKSWKSGKFLRFEVICFAAAAVGKSAVQRHRSSPQIHAVTACPTVEGFEPFGFRAVSSLCERYGPSDSESNIPPMGYGNIGALIAFAHGIPNNAPRLLYKKGKKWEPLFPARTTSGVHRANRSDPNSAIGKRLEALQERRLASLMAQGGLNPEDDLIVLVLAALKRRPRTIDTVSARTGLEIVETAELLARGRRAGWIDDRNRLTVHAYNEMEFLRRPATTIETTSNSINGHYFPTSLRVPREKFS